VLEESWWVVQTSLDVAELASEPNLRTWSRRFRLASVRGWMKGLTTSWSSDQIRVVPRSAASLRPWVS